MEMDKKHTKNLPAKKSRNQIQADWATTCGPLNEQIQGSQDWQPNQGIRDTILVLAGTVADQNFKNSRSQKIKKGAHKRSKKIETNVSDISIGNTFPGCSLTFLDFLNNWV